MQHLPINKKVYKQLKKRQKHIDKFMWIAGLLGPLAALPQVLIIFRNQSIENVSIVSWVLFTIISVVTLLYATVHHITPLRYSSMAWLVVYGTMLSGFFLYV